MKLSIKTILLFLACLAVINMSYAAPPTQYKEVYADAGSLLKGKIFVSDDATGISTYELNGKIIITSNIHYSNIDIKFKATAINAVLGYTPKAIKWEHKNDAGEKDSEGIVNLGEPDVQGFYHLPNMSLSTIILGGVITTNTVIFYNVSSGDNLTICESGCNVSSTTTTINNTPFNYITNDISNGIQAVIPLQLSNSSGTNNATNIFFNGKTFSYQDIIFSVNGNKQYHYLNATTGAVDVNRTINGTMDLFYNNPSGMYNITEGGINTYPGFDDFVLDRWVDTGSLIYVDTGNENLYFKGDRSATAHRSVLQVGNLSNFNLSFNITEIDLLGDAGTLQIGIADSDSQTPSDMLGVMIYRHSSGTYYLYSYKCQGGSCVTDDVYDVGSGAFSGYANIWRNGTTAYASLTANGDKTEKLWTGTNLGNLDYFIAKNNNDGVANGINRWVQGTADNFILKKSETVPWNTWGSEQNVSGNLTIGSVISSDYNITDGSFSETLENIQDVQNVTSQWYGVETATVTITFETLDNYTQIQSGCVDGICTYNNTASFNGNYDNVNITVPKVYNESSDYFTNFTISTNDENYTGYTETFTSYILHSSGRNASQQYFDNFTHEENPFPPLFRVNNLTLFTSYTGTLNNTFLNDSLEIVVTETTGTPSRLNSTFNLSNTVHTGVNYLLRFYGYYDGNPAHETHAFVKYCDNETFVEISNETYFINDANDNYSRIFPFTGNQYRCSNGSMVVKLEHIQTTSSNHYLHVNLLNIEIFPTLPKPTISGTTVVCGADDAFGCANLNSTPDDTYSLYHWYWRLNGTSPWNSSSNTTVNGTQIELTKGLTYDFRLYASNGYDFISEYSEYITITMATGSPQLDTIIANQNTIIAQNNQIIANQEDTQDSIEEAKATGIAGGILGGAMVLMWLKRRKRQQE